jgi:tRNA(His) 5'-end guanylyltransferase
MGDLDNRMKRYEQMESGKRFLPLLPVCARLDGKNFSRFTKGLERPYDKRISDLMISTAVYLVAETNARIGFCQSDEITLVWYSDRYDSQIFFDGKVQKMGSILASMATAHFNRHLDQAIPEKRGMLVIFDCRVWQVPLIEEAANVFLWRELDATRNSIEMAARHHFSHNQIFEKTCNEMQEMLLQKGTNWHNYPAFFKRGTFIQRRKVLRKFTSEEIEKLPPKHEARTNPDLTIERTEIRCMDMPPFSRVINRVGVIFRGEDPVVEEID